MFSSLSQGTIVYILDKTESPKLKYGEVVGVSAPKFQAMSTVVDLKINIDGNVQDFSNIPSNNTIVSYNNGKITISETKQGLSSEVESSLQNRKQILNNIEQYKKDVVYYEEILKELNPQFAKDKERDDRLNNLEQKFEGVENKLDKILNLVTK